MKPELFDISADVWNALSYDEIIPTADAMRKMDLYRLPVDGPITLRMPPAITITRNNLPLEKRYALSEGHFLSRAEDEPEYLGDSRHWLHSEFRDLEKDHAYELLIDVVRCPKNRSREDFALLMKTMLDETKEAFPGSFIEDGNKLCRPIGLPLDRDETSAMRDALVVILASKGVIKERKEHKLANLGIGKPAPYAATTTIKLVTVLPDGDETEAASRRPTRPHMRRGHIRHQPYGKGRELVKDVWIAPMFVNADASFVSARKTYKIR